MSRRVLCLALIVALLSASQLPAEEPKVIKPEDAKNHVDVLCVVSFKVKHTKHGVNRKTYFLDSKEDFRAEGNLGVQISEVMAAELKEKKGVSAPDTHYADKTVKVTGKIFLEEDRPYLRIEKVDHIEIVEDGKP